MGDKHHIHYMTLPDMYIKGVLELGIQYVEDDESAEIWVQEDIKRTTVTESILLEPTTRIKNSYLTPVKGIT
jgi:hypothetical protein